MTAILLSLDSLQAQSPAIYFWADCFFKASLIIGLASLFHWIYRHQSASSHGLIWLIAITSCLCIPVFKLFIPDIDLAIDIRQSDAPSSAGTLVAGHSNSMEETPSFKGLLLSALIYLYMSVLLAMLTNLLISIGRLFRISNQAKNNIDARLEVTLQNLMQSHGITAKVTLLVSSSTSTPFTWGLFHHRLVLPTAARHWNQQLIRQAIGHELGHIQRNDWIYQLFGRLTLCLYWPTPLLWHAAKCLKIASEKASDDTAADCSSSDVSYASNLLQLANCLRTQDRNARLAMPMFCNSSTLSLRIRHILLTDRNRSLLRSDEIFTATLMTLLLVVPFSSLQVSANMVAPVIETADYIPLDSTVAPRELILDVADEDDRVETLTAPQRLQHGTPAPELHANPVKRRSELNLADKPLTVDQREIFNLSAAELFLQWEATPLQTPAPEYPLVALRKGIEGHVVAEFDLDKDGNAINPRIIESVPTGTFDKAVLRAVEKFVYCPEIVDGIGGNNQPIRKRFSFALQE